MKKNCTNEMKKNCTSTAQNHCEIHSDFARYEYNFSYFFWQGLFLLFLFKKNCQKTRVLCALQNTTTPTAHYDLDVSLGLLL